VARIPRSVLVHLGSINHCCWQAHNHERLFDHEGAREKFLELLARHKSDHGILIHSYCLMGTHPHVLCTATRGQERFSAFWKVVNHGFARWINHRLRRRGQVVMERLGSPRVQPSPAHVLRVMRYQDRNPVEAGLVRKASHWRWSSHRHYALGVPDPLVDAPVAYLALGRTPAERRMADRHLVRRRSDELQSVRARWHGVGAVGCPFIGDPDWVARRCADAGLDPPS
jgi:putative transposase